MIRLGNLLRWNTPLLGREGSKIASFLFITASRGIVGKTFVSKAEAVMRYCILITRQPAIVIDTFITDS
jgi:hypothetical protein